jgi:hypothetical protein
VHEPPFIVTGGVVDEARMCWLLPSGWANVLTWQLTFAALLRDMVLL